MMSLIQFKSIVEFDISHVCIPSDIQPQFLVVVLITGGIRFDLSLFYI